MLCFAQAVNIFFAFNAVKKSDSLTNGYLINERKNREPSILYFRILSLEQEYLSKKDTP